VCHTCSAVAWTVVIDIEADITKLVLDFSSGISGIWPFFGIMAKSVCGQISSWIWLMTVQLQYVLYVQ